MEYVKHVGHEKRFFSLFIASLGVTVGIAYSGSLVTLYLFYELLTLMTCPLVTHAQTPEALHSGKKYLVYSFSGAGLALLGILTLFSLSGGVSFIPGGFVSATVGQPSPVVALCFVAMFLGFGVKAAVFPFHAWLPGAMVAPTPVTALLHAVAVVKSGVFAVTRTIYYVFGPQTVRETGTVPYLMALVVFTILLGSLLALRQDNLKKRLAYSTISQLSYILLGLLLCSESGLLGALLHMLNHATIKIVLFFCTGSVMYQTHITDVSRMEGIGRVMPITMGCFALSAAALVGIPPLSGFLGKWVLAQGALEQGAWLLPVVLLASAMLTAGYLAPVVTTAFFGGGEHAPVERHHAPPKMTAAVLTVTAMTVAISVYPKPIVDFVKTIVASVF
jgi:multicomponent Na+:H+ antiporter subunit D